MDKGTQCAIKPSMNFQPEIDTPLRARLTALCAEGWALWEQFDEEVRTHHFHPFVAADYDAVVDALIQHRGPNLRFLEWGAATGVIAIAADLLGFEAYGIELEPDLVAKARALAERFESRAKFVAGSFLPTGYQWRSRDGDGRTGTLGVGTSGYRELGLALDDFDVVFGYPWDGEQELMLDLMSRYGRADATLLLSHVTDGVLAYRGGGRLVDG
jgi:hypothetical protein